MKFLELNEGLIPYSLFDFANSSFTLIIHAYLFPLYFKNILFHGAQKADAIWGSLFTISVIIAAACAPFIGRIADSKGRYPFFLIFSILSFVSTSFLALTIGQNPSLVITAFVLANALFYIASNIYDSLLTVVATEDKRVYFSSFAWGFGYVGGVLSFAVVYLLQNRYGADSPWPYSFMAIFYSTFGSISVFTLRKHITGLVRKTRVTFYQMLHVLDKSRLYLLLGYWLIGDCISTIILFIAIYASGELKLSNETIGLWLLLVQILAFPNTYIMSKLSDKIGLSKTLTCCIAIWLIVIAMLVFNTNIYGLFFLSILTSLVIGSTQALMRAQYSLSLEKLRTSEIFGWYAIVTESSSVLAPLLFGIVSVVFNSQRLALGILAGPLVLGWSLIQKSQRV